MIKPIIEKPSDLNPIVRRPIRVLIAEDDAHFRLGLEHCLRPWGCTLVGATSNGREAIRLGREAMPDLLLLNFRLEGSADGVEVARAIRSGDPEVAVIFLSGETESKTLQRMRSIDGALVLPKPFDPQRLRTLMGQIDWPDRP